MHKNPSTTKEYATIIVKGIFGIKKGILTIEPVSKKYHTNDKADNPNPAVGLKKTHLEPCTLHQQKLMAKQTNPC